MTSQPIRDQVEDYLITPKRLAEGNEDATLNK